MEVKIPIVILHGWGLSGDRYSAVKKILEKAGYQVFTPNFPGFGGKKLLKPVMDLDDYVGFIHDFLTEENLEKVIFIGHSFGGRVATKFSYKYPKKVEKLILTGAPVIREPLSLKKKLIGIIARTAKKILSYSPIRVVEFISWVAYRIIGEWDYFKAGELRPTFVKIINEDLSSLLPSISTKSLLLWGEYDTFVPTAIGKKAAQRMQHAKYYEIPTATHKLPYEKPSLFAKAVLAFIEER
jgi:pimeloyl-ACP methyl ester carboxylesterase